MTEQIHTIEEVADFCYTSNYGTYTDYAPHDTPAYGYAFSDCIEDFYFNHLLHYTGNPEKILGDAKDLFTERNRAPTVCITPFSDLYDRKENIPPSLTKIAEDVWMRLDLDENGHRERLNAELENTGDDLHIRRANENDIPAYLDLFRASFGNADDVYGALPEGYLIAEERFFKQSPPFESRIYIGTWKGAPAGIVRTVSKDEKTFIYTLGVPKEYRKKGTMARALGAQAIQDAADNGARFLFVQTESGTVLERFYRLYGFRKLCTGTFYGMEETTGEP